MYSKRYVKHVGFGEGDDGWEIFKDDNGVDDIVAQVQTETLADALLNRLELWKGEAGIVLRDATHKSVSALTGDERNLVKHLFSEAGKHHNVAEDADAVTALIVIPGAMEALGVEAKTPEGLFRMIRNDEKIHTFLRKVYLEEESE